MDKAGRAFGILYTQNSFISGQYQLQFEQAFTNNRTNKWQTGHIITTSTWAHVAISYSSSSQSNIPGLLYQRRGPEHHGCEHRGREAWVKQP